MLYILLARLFLKLNGQIIQENRKEFYEIINEYQEIMGYSVLDFLEKSYAKFPDTFFYNPTHLNLHGAVQMTKVLDREIRKIILGEKELKKGKINIKYSAAVYSVAWMPFEENGSICGSSGCYLGLRGNEDPHRE